MTLRWRKLGCLYSPAGNDRHPKLLTHAANPLPVCLDGDIYRIFYSGRDVHDRSSVGAVDIDIVQGKVVYEHSDPFFVHGDEGSFYADGVSIGNCYRVGSVQYMLFMGWQNAPGSHWRGDIGRLVVKPDVTLELDSDTPFMAADRVDPLSLSYPFVIERPAGGYAMWYGSTMTWDAGNHEMLHVINYATSVDGHNWDRKGLGVPYEIGRAQAFSRPAVVLNPDGDYEMWFSYRSGSGEQYRIGYARSADGEKWGLKLNQAGIDVSPEGWDSEMIEYPFVLDHNKQRYLLYNGDGYGLTGFGLAVRER
jgi:hypothetical protein